MKLYKLFLTNNLCYKRSQALKPKGIMVHSTGANNPWLKRYVGPDDGRLGENTRGNHWNTDLPGGRKVCVHAFIGKLADGTVATYQTLPWDMRGWHAGGNGNNSLIGFEICEDGLEDKEYFDKVYKEAVELCVYLCKEFNFTEKDIICHSEGYKKGLASNHADVMHWFPKHGKSMDTFRADVKKLLEEDKEMDELKKELEKVREELKKATKVVYPKLEDVPIWAKETVEKLVEKGYLKGDEHGELNLDDTLVRVLVINDRAGIYG